MIKRCTWCGSDPQYMAYHDEDWGVRCVAVERLSDQALIANRAQWDEDARVREAAIARIEDARTLEKLADDREESIRAAARARLEQLASPAPTDGERESELERES